MRHPQPLLYWIFGLTLIVCGVLGAIRLGERLGWMGYFAGFLVPTLSIAVGLLMLVGLLYVWEVLKRAGPRYPPCHNGTCTGRWWLSFAGNDRGDYEYTWVDDEGVLRCRCGLEYVTGSDEGSFMQRLPDGTLKPYMVHKAFRGWLPDFGEEE